MLVQQQGTKKAVFKKVEAIFLSCKRSPEVGIPGCQGWQGTS